MAQRTGTELKVFLEGTLNDYQTFCADATAAQGSVFFNKIDHTIYVEGNKVVGTQVENVVWDNDNKILAIYPISGAPINVELGVDDALNALKAWANSEFEAKDATILRQTDVENSLGSSSTTAPLSAAQGKALSEGKVDKVAGKQLSTEDFTTALKTKLEGLSNYDDTELENAITALTQRFDTLLGSETGDADEVINTFNEIVAFLDSIKDTDTLDGILGGISAKFDGLDGRVETLENETKVKSINNLSGTVTIKGETQNIDDEGYHRVTPITFEEVGQAINAGINAEGMAILVIRALRNNELFNLENIAISENVTETDYELTLAVDNTPKVWSF